MYIEKFRKFHFDIKDTLFATKVSLTWKHMLVHFFMVPLWSCSCLFYRVVLSAVLIAVCYAFPVTHNLSTPTQSTCIYNNISH